MFGFIRRAWRSVMMLDADPFEVSTDADACDCEACRFSAEVEAITAAHIVALLVAAPDLASATARADVISEALVVGLDMCNHEWRLQDPDVQRAIEELDALYASPAYGEESWTRPELDAFDRIMREIAETEDD